MKVEIRTNILCAIKLFQSVKDIRYYLDGVYLDTGAHGARLVATDGGAMGVARIEGSFPDASIIIPSDLIKHIKHARRVPEFVEFEFDEGKCNGGNLRTINITFGATSVSGTEIDGRYCDYERVVPSSLSGEPAQFKPKYLSLIEEAQYMLGYSKWFDGIGYNGNSAGYAKLSEDAFAVVMPIRTSETQVAGWAHHAVRSAA
jgi:hypothetical protein